MSFSNRNVHPTLVPRHPASQPCTSFCSLVSVSRPGSHILQMTQRVASRIYIPVGICPSTSRYPKVRELQARQSWKERFPSLRDGSNCPKGTGTSREEQVGDLETVARAGAVVSALVIHIRATLAASLAFYALEAPLTAAPRAAGPTRIRAVSLGAGATLLVFASVRLRLLQFEPISHGRAPGTPKGTGLVRVWRRGVLAYFSVLGQIDLERLGVVLETQGRHGKKDILSVDSLSLLLVTLLRGCMEGSVLVSRLFASISLHFSATFCLATTMALVTRQDWTTVPCTHLRRL